MSLQEWLQITAEFRALWDRFDQLNPEEWMRLDWLFAAIQPSRSLQRTTQDRRQRLMDLWARRRSLSVREASQLDRGIRLLVQDIELQEWWSHRDGLSNPEWDRFGRLIYQALRANWGKFGSLPNAIPGDANDGIWDFISRKVFEAGQAANAKIDTDFHTGTLCCYFRNYLLDCLDQVQRDRLPAPEPPAGQQPAEFDLFEQLKPEDLHPCWDVTTQPRPDVEEVLKEAGLHWERVSQEARALIGLLEPEDHILLKCSLCADAVEHLPVDRLKTLLPHPAYRTIKLRKRLKRWLAQTLGIEPRPENASAMLAALKILCWRALLDIETDCAALRAQLHTADAPDTGAAPSA
jgi:hypothetical protein